MDTRLSFATPLFSAPPFSSVLREPGDEARVLDEVKGNMLQSNSELAALVDATSTLLSVSKRVRKWSWWHLTSHLFARHTRKKNGPTCLKITADMQESLEEKLRKYTDSPSTRCTYKMTDREIFFNEVAYLQHERKESGITSQVEFMEFCWKATLQETALWWSVGSAVYE